MQKNNKLKTQGYRYYQSKGGVGKTNITFNLSGALAEKTKDSPYRFGSAGKPFLFIFRKIFSILNYRC